ncbi:Ankyrin repeat domain containing protein [Pandoravirus salinus]|uniref:Ankyrin repeat domain containing protein n=1 Tax=Pandoravirus salinus TaxID=1349410 RepID=S4VZ27_9VIRU|nr:ankyrin repeat domain [Pandoravirus salinus]AGO85608.2 Ankyrin repeat domain containing protein [Pandoravirus salinus]
MGMAARDRRAHDEFAPAAPASLRSACAQLALAAGLAVLLCAWSYALEPWNNPTARALADDIRHRVTPGGVPPDQRLCAAASRCDVDLVRRLLAGGASARFDCGGEHGTPLHAAALVSATSRGNCLDTAEALLRAGADPYVAVAGRTALDVALAQDRLWASPGRATPRRPPLGLFLVSTISGRRARALSRAV